MGLFTWIVDMELVGPAAQPVDFSGYLWRLNLSAAFAPKSVEEPSEESEEVPSDLAFWESPDLTFAVYAPNASDSSVYEKQTIVLTLVPDGGFPTNAGARQSLTEKFKLEYKAQGSDHAFLEFDPSISQ